MRMFPAMLLVIVALGITLVIISGCRNQQAAANNQPTVSSAAAKITIAPDEAACPVMGTVMKKSAMIPVQYQGTTYYMCCQSCVGKFKADPEKYIKHPATPTREMNMSQ